MRKTLLYLLFCAVIASATCTFSTWRMEEQEEFHEELYVRPFPSGHVNTYFQFATRWHYGEKENLQHTRLMPRPIAEMLLHYDVKELHISLAQGLWRYEQWGYPVVDAAPGAEAWAWFAAPNLNSSQVDAQWRHLANTLSGIFCASLNFIDASNSVSPRFGFRPQFSMGLNSSKAWPKHVRYASLPREIVCTENLTPWKKLLPCATHEGFASLLNSGFVHNTNYHALAIKVRTICERPAHNCILEFTQSANLVYDPKLLGITSDFSMRRFFGQGLNGHCALAKSSKIYVALDGEGKRYELSPPPHTEVSSTRGGTSSTYAVYDVQRRAAEHEERMFNIAWILKQSYEALPLVPLPPLAVHRYLLGHGQEKGQLITQLTNTHYTPLRLVLQEHIPWFVPIYLHTLELKVTAGRQLGAKIAPRIVHYIPGIQRKRAYHLELAFELPAQSSVQLSLDFDYIFLKWLEYPPDANHGHYLGSAVVTVQLPLARNYTALPLDGTLFAHSFNASRAAYVQELRTEALLLSLPTPDFSMPYNVICLACTVVALAFGPIHSVATKRIVIEHKQGEAPPPLFRRLLNKVLRRSATPVVAVEPHTLSSKHDDELHSSADT